MKSFCVLIFSFFVSPFVNAQWTQTNGYFGGNINVLEVSGSSLFAGTDKGIYRSIDNGNSWVKTNTGIGDTIIYSLAISGSTIFAGTSSHGVYASTDNGNSWVASNVGMSNSQVRSLLVNGTNIFAGTENDGVFLSTDNGQNWTSINNGLINSPFRALISFNGYIYAGTFGEGIFRTNDNGNSWLSVNSGLLDSNAKKINAFATLGTKIYAGSEGGLYSTANGSSWTPPSSWFPVNSLKVNGTSIYVGTRAQGYDYFTGAIEGYYVTANNYQLGVNYGVLVSTNNASTWTPISNGLSYKPVNSIVFLGSTIVAGTLNTGVYISSNNGASWTSKNYGIGKAKVTSLVNESGTIYAGTFDSGMHKSTDGGNTWVEINKGILNYRITSVTASGSVIFAGTEGTGLFKTIDGGNTWTFCTLPTASTVFTFPVYIHSLHTTSNGKVYVSAEGPGSEGFFSTSNNGTSWALSGSFTGSSITSNGSYIYVGGVYSNGPQDLAISTNNGFSWSYQPVGTLGSSAISLETIGSNLFAGTDYSGVRTSPNNGSSWNPLIGSAPYGYRINDLTKYSSALFAGTENNGVYASNDNFSTSSAVNFGLLDSNILSLLVVGTDIYAGTLNGTVWKRSITEITQPPSAAGQISGLTSVCQNQNSVVFSVPPISNATSYIWTLPNGASGSSSTNTIVVDFSSSAISGDIIVKGINYFGEGSPSILSVAVNPLPQVTLSTFNSLCDTSGIVPLNGGSPVGGTYSGTSVTNNSFNTNIGIGTYPITYAYTDNNGCSSNTNQNLSVIECSGSGIEEINESGIMLYPNPASKSFTIVSTEINNGKSFEIYDVSGRTILLGKIEANKTQVIFSEFPSGTYYFAIPDINQVIKFIQQN